MQNRYAGDIGDFIKYGLLRAIAPNTTIGVAWYLFPDEGHNEDGRHTAYLQAPEKWRNRDPALFDSLKDIVARERRSVSAIEASGTLGDARFASEILDFPLGDLQERRRCRRQWFARTLKALQGCRVVFADPDNGLCEDDNFSYGRVASWKRLPLSEARALAEGRTAVLYHHNTRRKGGHALEIDYWVERLGEATRALRWRAFSNRTFFIVNPSPCISARLESFAKDWAPEASLHN